MRVPRIPLVMGLLFVLLWSVGAGANAQPGKKYPPATPSVLPSVLTPAPSDNPSPPPSGTPSSPPSVEPSRQPREPLPFTGADLTLFVIVGVGLAAAGTVLVRVARRVRSDS